MNWKHAAGISAVAILSVAGYVWVFAKKLPSVPVLSAIAGLITGR